jgi:hypothetical protein
MHQLKPISSEAVPRALAKAERYRLLNEPQEAESICLDILRAEPDNQQALVMLLLAVTDQFGGDSHKGVGEARRILARLRDEFDRLYYGGVICERWLKAQLRSGAHSSLASGWFIEALSLYEKARLLSPPGNDDAILRWNACVRLLERNPDLGARFEETASESGFAEGAPHGRGP